MTALVTPGGGYCVAVPGQDAVDLVPGLPQPERPGNGPSVRLLDTGDAVHCSLGACWPIEEEWLRRELPGRLGLSGRATQLRVAVLGTPTLTLAVAATAGAPQPAGGGADLGLPALHRDPQPPPRAGRGRRPAGRRRGPAGPGVRRRPRPRGPRPRPRTRLARHRPDRRRRHHDHRHGRPGRLAPTPTRKESPSC
ncbi:MAG: hypothetical protein HZY73_13275 [Micropruina sp.]|nr:MAG: hypothetical protein HZY73_13275 [Micropruina sp.]